MDLTEPGLEALRWITSKTYAHKAPHQYITRQNYPEEFDALKARIEAEGTMEGYQLFSSYTRNRYLHIGEYRYWAYDFILNRAKNSDYKRTPEGTWYYPAAYTPDAVRHENRTERDVRLGRQTKL